jgi:hypothetical protein
MAETTKLGKCQQLQQQIDNITAEISQNNNSIKDVQEKIKKTSSAANALGLSDRPFLQEELKRLQTEAIELTKKNTSLQSQLNALHAAFQQSGLQCVNERFECSGPNDEILSIPLFIAQGPAVTFDTSGLEAEKTKLENERDQKLQPILDCLDETTGIKVFIDRLLGGNGDLVHPAIGSRPLSEYLLGNKDLDPKVEPLLYVNRQIFYNYIVDSLGNCLNLTDGNAVAPKRILSLKSKLETILTDKNSWTKTTRLGIFKAQKQHEIIDLVNSIIPELNNEKIKIQRKYTPVIEAIQTEIEELSNSNSNFNKQSSNTIIDIIKTVKNQAPAPQILSTTTVSAPGGPGLPVDNPCNQTVTKTLGSDSKAVSFEANSYSIVLNPERAILEFGPGGCTEENPIWLHPVNITTNNISVSNIEDIKNFLLNKLQEDKKYQEIEKRTSTNAPGIVTPINQFDIFTNFSLNDKVLRTCVSAPK